MSPFFVKKFKGENHCKQCPKSADGVTVANKLFCQYHLTKARLIWRVWGARRRQEKLCISCDGKSWLNPKTRLLNCRCKKHREINRVKCLTWTHNNKDRTRRAWLKRKELITQGICICPMRNPLKPGALRCDDCRDYNRACDTGNKRLFNKIRAKRRKARFQQLDFLAGLAKKNLVVLNQV